MDNTQEATPSLSDFFHDKPSCHKANSKVGHVKVSSVVFKFEVCLFPER